MKPGRTEAVFELMASTSQEAKESQRKQGLSSMGILRGVISEFDQVTGRIYIVVPNLSLLEPMVTRSIVPITQTDVGREVLVVFEAGETQEPFIVGLLWEHGQAPKIQGAPIEAKVDGQRIVVEGEKEIVLKCGKASITLTREGKVLIRGAYLLSRSSGVNRVKGGSVQIN